MNDSYLIYSFFIHNLACFIQDPFKFHSWLLFFSSMVHMQDISASCKFRALKGICFISISCMRHVIPVSYTKRGFMFIHVRFMFIKYQFRIWKGHARFMFISYTSRTTFMYEKVLYSSCTYHVCVILNSCMLFMHGSYMFHTWDISWNVRFFLYEKRHFHTQSIYKSVHDIHVWIVYKFLYTTHVWSFSMGTILA